MLASRHHPAKLSSELRHSSAQGLFAEQAWSDLWIDAKMPDVVRYLKGNKHLKLPGIWEQLLQEMDNQDV